MLLYITVMLKPLLPIVTDWYEHEFNPIQHQIQVHMIYGNHHLDKDLAEGNSEDDHNKNPATSKTSDPVSVHLVVHSIYDFPYPSAEKLKFAITTSDVTTISLASHYPPPRLANSSLIY